MQTHSPTAQMATAAAVEADADESVIKTGDNNSPSTVVLGEVKASSDTGDEASEWIVVRGTGDEACDKSSIPSGDSDVGSPKITLASRQHMEQRDDGLGSAYTKIPSDSNARSATIITIASRCDNGSYAFEACMISVSFLVVLSSPLLLRHLYSEPLALMCSVASFISAYIIFLIFIFSPTMCRSTVFFHMPYPVLLAIAAGRFLGLLAGFLVMHLATAWFAGLLGYAYAEHLQHIGRETTAKRITPPNFLTEEDERSFKEACGLKAVGFGLLSLLMVTAGVLLLRFVPTEVLPVSVGTLAFLEANAIIFRVLFVSRFVLHDALLSADQLVNINVCYVVPNVLLGYIVLLVNPICFLGAMCLWWLMLSLAGLLGYELSVHAQYKIMLERRAPELQDGLSSATGESDCRHYF